jgi:hypothetical protein
VANGKDAVVPEWQKRRADSLTDAEIDKWWGNGHPKNLAVLLGEPSGGTVDLDCDCSETVVAAPSFAPLTPWLFGRPTRPRSHRTYRVPDTGVSIKLRDPITRKTIVELRGHAEDGPGKYTIFPPGTRYPENNDIPAPEPIGWYSTSCEGDGPAESTWAELEAVTYRIGAAALLERYWPAEQGGHENRLHLAGALARLMTLEDALTFMLAIPRAQPRNPDEPDVRRVLGTAYKRLAHDSTVTGWPAFQQAMADAYGNDVAQLIIDRVREWLAIAYEPTAEGAASSSTPEWLPPIPFNERTVPPFPLEVLPEYLRDFAEALATATQTPADMAAMLALAVTGGGLARKFRVEIRPGWTQPANLYVFVALGSGNRKSAVIDVILVPLKEVEQIEVLAANESRAIAQADKELLEKRIRAMTSLEAKKPRKKTEGEEDSKDSTSFSLEELHELVKELAGKDIPSVPVLIVDDITQESLGVVLYEQGGQLLIASAEATLFDLMGGRYSGQLDIDVLLKGHDGDDLRVNRLGRSPVYVSKPAISTAIVMQPCVIGGLAVSGMMRGRGLLARPLWILPKSIVGHRQIRTPSVPDEILGRYNDVTRKIWMKESRKGEDGLHLPQVLRFSSEADEAMAEFEEWLEPQLGPDGELAYIADWGCKLAGEAARIALILHMAEGTAKGGTFPATIPEETVRRAIRLARDYLLPHALAAFDIMGADPRIEEAKILLRAIGDFADCAGAYGPAKEFSKRDLFNKVRKGAKFRTVDSLDVPLRLLVEHNFLREKGNEKKSRSGRPPSPVFEINPLWDSPSHPQNPHNPQNPSSNTDHHNFADYADFADLQKGEKSEKCEKSPSPDEENGQDSPPVAQNPHNPQNAGVADEQNRETEKDF